MGKDGEEKDRWWYKGTVCAAFEAIQSPVHLESMRKREEEKKSQNVVCANWGSLDFFFLSPSERQYTQALDMRTGIPSPIP